MQNYKRKITYFYQYHNGNVGSTAGFLKLEIRGDKVKIVINIQEPPGLPYKEASLYFYHEAGDHLSAVKVDKIRSEGGVLTYQNRTSWQQLFDTGRDLYTFDGVAVVYADNHYYIGDFEDRNRKNYPLEMQAETQPVLVQKAGFFGEQPEEPIPLIRNKVVPEEEVKASMKTWEDIRQEQSLEQRLKRMMEERENKIVEELWGESKEKKQRKEEEESATEQDEKCENCPYRREIMEHEIEGNPFEKMVKTYPKLPMYGVTELFDCVRIHPRDIGKLDMRNWKLGVNSFLTHGFYIYQYLLLGKVRFDDGQERPIIGVPGVFSNREKYLANMFGFEQFIPLKKTGTKTGEFGYWIVEISPYL